MLFLNIKKGGRKTKKNNKKKQKTKKKTNLKKQKTVTRKSKVPTSLSIFPDKSPQLQKDNEPTKLNKFTTNPIDWDGKTRLILHNCPYNITPIPMCMPDIYIKSCAISSYRNYYKSKISNFLYRL